MNLAELKDFIGLLINKTEAKKSSGSNCGIGSGGFKAGNKCAKGGSGSTSRGPLESAPGRVDRVAIAKANHVLIARDDQQRADKLERQLAKSLGGYSFKDSEPADIVIGGKKGTIDHGIEVKALLKNTNDKISMDMYAKVRKSVWEKKNKATFHTIVIDARTPKTEYYYRRGIAGSARLANLEKVSSPAALKKLIQAAEKDLPANAQRTDGKLRTGTWKQRKDRTYKNTVTGQVAKPKK